MRSLNFDRDYLWAALLFIAALAYYHAIYLFQGNLEMPLIYQQRDLFRAIDLYAKGIFIWHGPELSGGGYSYGPFYYWLIGLPLFIFKSVEAVIYFEYILAAICLAGTWYYLKNRYSALSAFTFYFLFLNSPVFNFQLRTFWNPSFLFIFIWLIWVLSENTNSKFRLAATSFLIGLALQVHFSMLLVGVALGLNIIFSSDARTNKINKLALAALFMLMPLLPFFYYQLFLSKSYTMYENLGGGFDRLYATISALSFRQVKEIFILFIREIYFIPGVIALWYYRKDFFAKNKFLFFASLSILIPLYMLFFDTSYIRYFIPVLYFIMVATSIYLPQLIAQKPRYMFYLISFFTFAYLHSLMTLLNHRDNSFNFASAEFGFFLVSILLALFAFRRQIRQKLFLSVFLILSLINLSFAAVLPEDNLSDYEPYMVKMKVADKLVSDVMDNTGWSYEHFRRHSYVVGINIELDFSYIYQTAYQKAQPLLNSAYDGVLIVNQIGRKLIPKEFSKIICTRELTVENFDLCYYRFKDSPIALQWNNTGYAYREETEPKLDLVVTSKQQIHILGEQEAAFTVNPCRAFDKRCLIIFKLSILKDDWLAVQAMGDALGVAFSEQSPFFALSLDKPQLIFECADQVRTIEITQKIGFSWNESKATFLTPFDTLVKIPCAQPKSISLQLQNGKSIFAPGNKNDGFFPVAIKWDLRN